MPEGAPVTLIRMTLLGVKDVALQELYMRGESTSSSHGWAPGRSRQMYETDYVCAIHSIETRTLGAKSAVTIVERAGGSVGKKVR